ncbi:MAG: penicillin-binding transpeptidase domain-containing protein, partial [Solirubrobacteraceae bacterium]
IRRRRLGLLMGAAALAGVIVIVLIPRGGSSNGPLERAATGFAAEVSGDGYGPARRVLQGMSPARGTVTAGNVRRSGSRAEATLRWHWALPFDRSWSYTTVATFVLRQGRWLPLFSPRLVQPSLRDGDVLRLTVTQAPRAGILAGDGQPIVVPRPVVNVGVEPKRVHNLPQLAQTLYQVLGTNPAALIRAVRSASPTAFVPVITLRRDAYERLRSVLYPLPGTVFTTGTLPLAPTRTFARSLFGVTGNPTAQMLSASHGRYTASMTVGLSGLEQTFDNSLGGTPGITVAVLDANGNTAGTLYRVAPRAGTPLRTTLEVPAQNAADAALSGVRQPSALVAIRISTGKVIASAIGPDPGAYNIAFQGTFPPGSTFKIVTTLALLDQGEQPSDTVNCPADISIDGRQFHNAEHEVLGPITFAHAFAASCNTAFAGLAPRVSGTTLPRTAAMLGLGRALSIGVPAFAGDVPAPTDPVDRAAEAFGQGQILVSPLAMVSAAAAVARGRWLPPELVEDRAASGSHGGPPLPSGPVATLRTLMREVVTSGTANVLASQPGLPVYGKTGTAETGTSTPPRTDAWFVGYQGDVAFAALVANTTNGFGGAVAAPIVGRFLAKLQP